MCGAMGAMTYMGECASLRKIPRSTAILYVDTNPTDLYRMDIRLRGAGHSVSVASNVADALLLLKVFHYDMLLLDLVPGFKCLTAEARRMYPAVRIVVCTEDFQCSHVPFVDAVLQKPLPASAFLGRISELLAVSRYA